MKLFLLVRDATWPAEEENATSQREEIDDQVECGSRTDGRVLAIVRQVGHHLRLVER